MPSDNLQLLLDRQAIADCVARYARGIDRADPDLVASCYHEDALDDHGEWVGPGWGLAGWALERQSSLVRTQNHITTHSVDIDGDTAHGETYFLVVSRAKTGTVMLSSGRYVDRFERRHGEWRIAARVCIVESIVETPGVDMSRRDELQGQSARDRSDLSYRRPLMVDRPLTGG